jgi:hypothetical protein
VFVSDFGTSFDGTAIKNAVILNIMHYIFNPREMEVFKGIILVPLKILVAINGSLKALFA